MKDNLKFNPARYAVRTLELDGQRVVYRAFMGISYAERPADREFQILNLFAPEAFFAGAEVNGYSFHTAPIFMPNTVGGYRPGPADQPGRGREGAPNAIFCALGRGYVVAAPGLRGSGMTDGQGTLIGTAPAVICDYKAAVRWLRHNRDAIPGDTEKIITNGTSAGGAVSALMGAAGNHPDYEPFLRQMGAADERDDVFAASCYCPITNLDHADMAYEWEFGGIYDYHREKILPPAPGESKPTILPDDGVMTPAQIALSEQLKPLFPAYLNSLGLTDDAGAPLTLDERGDGSWKDYVLAAVLRSAQGQLDRGEDLSGLDWLTVKNGRAAAADFSALAAFRTRMKPAPAFDSVTLDTPENLLFGTSDTPRRHFTRFAAVRSQAGGAVADGQQIKMMNPMCYIGDGRAVTAKHFRIRHGTADRDTSLAISAMLTAKLRMCGVDAGLEYPWGIPHAGDYDLPQLFAWIDSLCR